MTDKEKIKMLKAYIKLLGAKYQSSEAKITAIHKMIPKITEPSENTNKILRVIGPDNPSQSQFVKKIVKDALAIIKEIEKNSKSSKK